MPTNTEIANELSRLAQENTSSSDPLVISTSIALLAAGEVLQNYGYARTYFIADRAYDVTSIREAHDFAQTSADGAALQVVKQTGTTAPTLDSDGLLLLTDVAYDGSGDIFRGFNLKAAVNTVSNATLTTTATSLRLAVGDRLVFGINGTIATTFISLTTVLQKV